MWTWLKRALTLPKRWNSVADVQRDPLGALDLVRDILRNLQFVAAVLGKPHVYDRLGTAIRIIDEVRECFEKPSSE